MNKNLKKPLASAIGAAFLASAAFPAMADSNPFSAKPLSSGYDLVSRAQAEEKQAEGKCGEGKCGGEMSKTATEGKASTEGKCGDMEKCKAEGKCGDEKKCATEGDGKKCMTEGKCGDEKKCSHGEKKLEQMPADSKKDAGSKAMSEGSCGDM